MNRKARKAAEELKKSRGTGSRALGRPKISEDGWEPTARDLSWYHEWSVNFRRQTEIALEYKTSRQLVHNAIKRVDKWLRSQLIDDILQHRQRQAEALEQLAVECRVKWINTSEVEYAEEFRKILADIRKMLGVDKPQQIEVAIGDGLERVAGMQRDDAIRAQANALLATIGEDVEVDVGDTGDAEDSGDADCKDGGDAENADTCESTEGSGGNEGNGGT